MFVYLFIKRQEQKKMFLEDFSNEEVKKVYENNKETRVQMIGFCHNLRINKKMMLLTHSIF